MKISSGVSLAMVSALRTTLLCLIPRTLMAAIAPMIPVIAIARGPLRDIAGQ